MGKQGEAKDKVWPRFSAFSTFVTVGRLSSAAKLDRVEIPRAIVIQY